jgi:hypothetical protein
MVHHTRNGARRLQSETAPGDAGPGWASLYVDSAYTVVKNL